MHTKNSETVEHNFRGEAGFVASLDKACGKFVKNLPAEMKGEPQAATEELEYLDVLDLPLGMGYTARSARYQARSELALSSLMR